MLIDNNTSKTGGGLSLPEESQFELFEMLTLTPRMPSKNSKSYKCLEMLKTGQAITQPDCMDVGWRLAAYIYDLKKDGWPILSRDIATKDGVIAAYKLSPLYCNDGVSNG